MANERTDPLTLPIGGIPVKGELVTDLDTGIARWYPKQGVLYNRNNYLTSTQKPNGSWSGWTSSGDVFGTLRSTNSQISSAYSTTSKLATAFYGAGTGLGSPTGTLNNGRLNQFKVYGAPVKAQTLNLPGATAAVTQTQTPAGTAPVAAQPDPRTIPTSRLTLANVGDAIEAGGSVLNRGTYAYPTSIDSNTQDYIKFDIIEYRARSLNNPITSGPLKGQFKIDANNNSERLFGETKATVILPISSGISDENSVQWGGEDLDAITAYFAGKSFNAIAGGQGGGITATLRDIGSDIQNILKDNTYMNALMTYLAGQAVGTNNLLSRTSGAIVNPNLELLFQGPSLRPFNFNFKLSPRDESEAETVKKIIRVFKEAGAVRAAEQQLFLKAPHVFRIKYIDGTKPGQEHKSLNLIKECALLSCSVNYTPENTYMTFADDEHTMVSYDLSLRFSELEPVTTADYIDHPIGY